MIAARLSEDPANHVVLIEAGPDLLPHGVPAAIDAPSFLAALDLEDRLDPIVATRVAGGPATPYRRGRGVGGSSSVNAMVALRGAPELYRSWRWDDTDAAWEMLALPVEPPADHEIGPVDRALLAADPSATVAELTRRHGRRVTAAEAYLWPARGRANLEVRAGVPVDRVALDGRRAVGVVLADGEEVSASRVVLAAGAIRSPWLLLRSGVDTAGIGDGLQDHPSAVLTLQLRAGRAADPASLVIGSLSRRGAIQFLPMNHLGPQAPGLGAVLVALMTPRSAAGTVRVADDGDPLVDFALLADPADLDALSQGVGQAIELLRTPAFVDLVAQVYVDSSGTPVDALGDVGAIRAWLPTVVGDYVHASSTCAMGVVVDDDAAVFGYERLHVADASVFPSIPDVNTHLPTTMLAERLCARWRRRST